MSVLVSKFGLTVILCCCDKFSLGFFKGSDQSSAEISIWFIINNLPSYCVVAL